MVARPKGVTAISWFLIIGSVIALVFVVGIFVGILATKPQGVHIQPRAAQLLWGIAISAGFQLLIAMNLLSGENWARVLFLAVTPITITFSYFGGAQIPIVIIHVAIYVIFAFYLNLPAPASFFSRADRVIESILAAARNNDFKDINRVLANGRTPLMVVAEAGDVNAVALLLSGGASPKETTMSGFTAADLAKMSGHSNIADMINEASNKTA